MNLRTYHAPSIADALGQIKRDLGSDAVILHTRTYKLGGFLGFGARRAVEITASSAVSVMHPLARKGKVAPDEMIRRGTDLLRKTYGAGGPPGPAPTGALAEAPESPAQHRAHRPSGREDPSSAARDVAHSVIAAATSQAPDAVFVGQELASIKRLVTQVLRSSAGTIASPALPEALSAMYLRLIQEEVATEIADSVVSEVRDELSATEQENPELVRERVLRRLERFIPVEGDAPRPGRMPDGRPLTIALVGPTGVGKTTTIAKLAAAYKLKHGKKVGLVTCDTYRIAAVEQLRTYANIIGLRLNVALTPAEMSGCCAAFDDCDVVLIDTAGRSQHDSDRLEELGKLLAAANPHETHLVLSGTSTQSVQLRTVKRFGVARPNRVILTKLDETVCFGALVNMAHQIDASISYITTGQEVPDHIEVGRAGRLARLVLDGGGVR